MSILPDIEIEKLCLEKDMINPFLGKQQEEGIISYGLSSYGYDARVSGDFKVFTNVHSTLIDPKNFHERSFVEFKDAEYCIIPPNSFALASTKEYFKIPRDVMVVCVGKSTYARCGIIINVTPLEPEWEGHVTLEISNTTNIPVKIYANEGICQFLFFKGSQACIRSYKDKAGKYQGQTGITLARIKEQEPKYLSAQIFDNGIYYGDKLIFSGNVQRFRQCDIDKIIETYKNSMELK